MRRATLVIAGLLSSTLPSVAAAPAIQKAGPVYVDDIRNYSDEQGLQQASITSIVQTHDGYLWLSTFGGLVRYDGQHFATFHIGQIDSATNAATGPGSERIVKLLEDTRQRLWIATQDAGVSVYEDGHFHAVPFICSGNCQIIDMASAPNQPIWVLTRTSLYRINPGDLSHEELELPSGSTYHNIGITRTGEVYLGGMSGLARVETNGVLKPIPLPNDSQAVVNMTASGTTLWIFSAPDNLYRYRPEQGEFLRVRSSLPYDTQLFADSNGTAYISDSLKGARELAESGAETPSLSVPGVNVISIHGDNEGDTWFGTGTKGLWRKRKSGIGLMDSPDMRMDGPGRSISSDGKGGLWFGLGSMSYGGLRHWSQGGELQILMLPPEMHNQSISSLLLDRKGNLWIATATGFLGKLIQGRVQQVAAVPAEGSLTIWQSANADYWLSSTNHSYRLLVDQNGNIQGKERIPALDGVNVTRMVDAKRGGIWFIGNRGIYRVLDGRIVEQWFSGDSRIHPGQFRALYEDDDGSIWVGTYGAGLIRIKNGQIRQFDESSGLLDNTVSCMLPDDDGRLWLAGNRGLSILRNRTTIDHDPSPVISLLSASDGLNPPEFNGGTNNACYRAADGRMWFSLISGFAVVDLARFQNLMPPAPIAHIEQIKVNGLGIDVSQPSIALNTRANSLEIGFGGTALAHPELLRYRYRLGKMRSANDWVETGSTRDLLISTLPWGKFVFEVQASLSGSAWSPSARFHFDHPTPWYRYQLIWLSIGVVAFCSLLWAVRKRNDGMDYTDLLNNLRARQARRTFPGNAVPGPPTPPMASPPSPPMASEW